jgi:GNAT superfamily N-acetyltransferase
MMNTDLGTFGAAELAAQAEPLEVLYRDCFAAPPWSEPEEQLAGYSQRLAGQLAHPGAGGLLAYAGPTLVGAVYGWPAPAELPTGTAFDDAVAALVTPALRPLLVAPSTVVAELMIATSHRRQGLAGLLLDTYLADRPSAWLSTHTAADARRFYRRRGWNEAAEFTVDGAALVLCTWTPS